MSSLPQSSSERLAFRNPMSQRPGSKAEARKMYLWWKRIRSGNTWANWTFTSSQALLGCTHKCWGTWQMWLWGHSIIFAWSWQLGEVPEDWRKAHITPIFKKRKKGDPGNYRLVNLTSILGKVNERLVLETISRHLKIIRFSQHEFTKVCRTQILICSFIYEEVCN